MALAQGATYVGKWSIPIRINGRLGTIAGGLWHAPDPSLVWFWPIVVLLACTLAARRVQRLELNQRLARVLAIPALIAAGVAGAGRELYGRPSLSVLGVITFAIVLALVTLGLHRVILRHAGSITYFLISFLALWEGAQLVPTLTHGFVLTAAPPILARTATVISLGCGAALLLLDFRIANREPVSPDEDSPNHAGDIDDADDRQAYA